MDLARPLTDGAEVALLTTKDEDALEVLRHSAAHLMADAICRVFPKGPAHHRAGHRGWLYYDIHLPDGKITPEDFPGPIGAEMLKVAKAAHPFAARELSKDPEALNAYMGSGQGENVFKHEIVDGIKERGEDLSFYQHGDFVDVCSGPHVPKTRFLENVKPHQRVRLVLARRSSPAPSSSTSWPTPCGSSCARGAFPEVKAPLVLSETLWHTSGHYANYMENMFFTKQKVRDAR
ncbi:threonine--tRNA ligase-like [Penaeus monodon]|uniref:threonine--tRNA ligase-like n=1 Tax=Penaeus monodon TaxID=6687 RepID=UPI0018A7D523|nr:threonine--tRNA ligase-like [Penaeus monodon]